MHRCRAGRSDRALGRACQTRSRGQPVMVRRLNAKDASFAADFDALLFAKREIEEDVAEAVRGLIADVRRRGDTALVELTNKFDRANITAATLKISAAEID